MGIKIGDLSMLGGAITGKGLFGKGLGAANKVLGPMAGVFPRMAASAQKKNDRRAMVMAELEAQKRADFNAKRNAAAGMRGRPMVEDIMMAEQVPAMKKGGKVSAAQAVHKHERAKHKGQPLTKMAKGGSTASKRADGCATKGKTKGRFV
jgi:hypothetical protein